MLSSLAVVLEQPERIALTRLALDPPGAKDIVVETEWSGISAGTERLLFKGRMPPFPGMGYPLVPGYESVGRVVDAGSEVRAGNRRAGLRARRSMLWPDARPAWRRRFASRRARLRASFRSRARSARRPCCSLWPRQRSMRSPATTTVAGVLIVGHGVLGRLLARLALLAGGKPPVVWEKNRARTDGAVGYEVISPEDDKRADYRTIFDVSGDFGNPRRARPASQRRRARSSSPDSTIA